VNYWSTGTVWKTNLKNQRGDAFSCDSAGR
jgi:hypothetical protein